MKNIIKAIDKIIKIVLVILMVALSVLAFYQVVSRSFWKVPAWNEEAIRFLFVWASCLGAAVGIKEHVHIGIDVVVNMLPQMGRNYVAILVQLVLLFFDVFIVKYGLQLVSMTLHQPSPALRLPMGYVYLAVPALGILGAFYSLVEIGKIVQEIKGAGNNA